MICYGLLISTFLMMELFVKWQRMKLNSTQETSVGGILKKTGIISFFVSSVFLIHLVWKIKFGANAQHLELFKDFVTLTVIFVLLPINTINNNKHMKKYILKYFSNYFINSSILDLYSVVRFKIALIFCFKKTNSISMIVIHV